MNWFYNSSSVNSWFISLAMMISLSGCSTISYYSQSALGHTRLMMSREPVDKLIRQAEPELKRRLKLAQQLRAFAISELKLPETKSYTHYVALEREFPVWNVVAAPEFSLQAKQWCYPVIGCAVYRGYFNKTAAHHYASKLQVEGFETVVVGAPAYSTLGWFADPLLSSMFRYGDVEFAETLFHELAHQQLYVNGDSNFNEAFATVVGETGVRRWLSKTRSDELGRYQSQLDAVTRFNSLINETKQKLNILYQQHLTPEQMRAAKVAEFDALKRRYDRVRNDEWGGQGWFDHWFNKPLNNARLAVFSTYREKVPAFEQLLADCQGDLAQFYSVVATVSNSDLSSDALFVPPTCDESSTSHLLDARSLPHGVFR